MTKFLNSHLRSPLFGLALGLAIATGSAFAQTAAVEAPRPVGFVAAVKGQPTIKDQAGAQRTLKPLQTFLAGSAIILTATDSLDICHEAAATAFRIEGVGQFNIEPNGIVPQDNTLKITQRGRCGRSVPPSVPGGVLFRRIEPTQ